MSEAATTNPVLRIFVLVLAVIGGGAVLAVTGMAVMHVSMMGGGIGC
ncbi:MAG: hypothetical protein ABIN96_15465 [Rubrivivax sp.]